MLRRWVITGVLALISGGVAAWLLVPRWLDAQAIRAVASDDAEARRAAWDRLMSPVEQPRILASLDEVFALLDRAADDAVLDAAERLALAGRWSWDSTPAPLILRELEHHALHGDMAAQHQAATRMETCPLDASPPRVAAVFDALAQSADEAVRFTGLRAALAWAPAQEAAEYAYLATADSSPRVQRFAWLARVFLPRVGKPDFPARSNEPLDVLEARLFAHGMLSPHDCSPILAAADTPHGPQLPIAYLLRAGTDRRVRSFLEQRAEAGDVLARRVLQARDPERDGEAAWLVLRDESQPPTLRRLAAWRVPERILPVPARRLLAADPRETDGSVLAAALLAERLLDDLDARALAATWLADFNDDFKRAGALLAALKGGPLEALEQAAAREDVSEVKALMDFAWLAAARGRGGSAVDAERLALAMAPGSGAGHAEPRPDIVACALLAGDSRALAALTSRPSLDDATWAVQWRSWLLERFAPPLAAPLGRPVGGDARAVLLHFEALDALRVILSRRLRFDPGRAVYAIDTTSTASGLGSAGGAGGADAAGGAGGAGSTGDAPD
ncbi:MAG: hypothetical protein HRU76_07875 [Phycisphaeraceae bacterium]|nr:MAG: hypothetical protein HRU76_07875 [Phycisphaeraceae bacterium]